MNSTSIRSPINPDWPSRQIASIPRDQIKKLYAKGFGIDIAKYIPNHISEVQIRQCTQTGYRYYFPFGIEGDGAFYGQLEKYPWYYDPWKWEYDQAIESFCAGDRILEIGSGGNVFLSKLRSLGFQDATGLELNLNSVRKGQEQGLTVLPDSIQEHALQRLEYYDVVTSFQVLEHISDVNSFIKSAVATLKPGGRLIVSVPNNNSYLGADPNCTLNFPPHHMGLWTRDSLESISECFGLDVLSTHFEPMSHFRRPYFYSVLYASKRPRMLYKIASKLACMTGPTWLERKYSAEFLGFTIQVHYQKR